jgi:hypothetical protein
VAFVRREVRTHLSTSGCSADLPRALRAIISAATLKMRDAEVDKTDRPIHSASYGERGVFVSEVVA